MHTDPEDSGVRWPNLSERIRATEEKVRELEARGAPEAEIRAARWKLDALRSLPADARIFLQSSGEEDGMILGFELPEGPDSTPPGPEGAA